MPIGQSAPTSEIAALRGELANMAQRIGELERARLRPIRGVDSDDGPKNLNATGVVACTVTLTIPQTWSSGWSYEAVGMQVIRDKGAATATRSCTLVLERDASTVEAMIGTAVTGSNRKPLPITWMERGITDVGSVEWETNLTLSTNDDYEVRSMVLWVRAERDS